MLPFCEIRAARGATLVAENTQKAVSEAVTELLLALTQANQVECGAIIGVWFTLTPDLTAENPAKVARMALGWSKVPMLCAVEPLIEGFPPSCLRVLIQWQEVGHEGQLKDPPRFVYLNGAEQLRDPQH
ncbi:MAG: chorismate mutase [Vampirovibrionales bacterium]